MPKPSLDRLKKKETSLTGKIAGGGALAAERVRGFKKQLRRTQRRRRKLTAQIARNAPKPKKTDASAT